MPWLTLRQQEASRMPQRLLELRQSPLEARPQLLQVLQLMEQLTLTLLVQMLQGLRKLLKVHEGGAPPRQSPRFEKRLVEDGIEVSCPRLRRVVVRQS